MDYALTMLVLWGLLFVPVGLAIHGLVLGESARVRALPIAPITGLATGLLVLAVLARFGVNAGDGWVIWAFVAASVVSVAAIWRWKITWRSRELIGAGLLLVLAIFLVQLPVVGKPGDGPLGYGTAANPVEEVAAIDAAIGGNLAKQDISREAAHSAKDRPVAFEQFAALTVSLGYDEHDEAGAAWTAYALHAALTGMLAALVALPLFAFARARGVRWLGLVFLVPIGVIAPYTFLALANGSGAAVATVPLFAAAVFSLLVTTRDRGWWSLTVIFGAAMATTAGALAILPLLTIGVVWIFLRATTYEHLAQVDAPVGRVRALAPGVIGASLGIIGVASTLSTGALLAWPRLHQHVFDALRSWPFAWLDTDLSTAGPHGGVETAVWLAGPVLLIVALVHGVIRNERRELAVLGGAVLAAAVGMAATGFDRAQGIRIYEYTILVTSPLLAALAVRGVSLAREHAERLTGRTRITRLAGWLPAAIIVAFVTVSVAATTVVGTRMVHAPKLDAADVDNVGTTLVAGGDQWLAFVVDGTRVPGNYADPDALATKAVNSKSTGYPLGAWDTLVTSNSPLGSDPPSRFVEDPALDSYQARLFYDRSAHKDHVSTDTLLDAERQDQSRYKPAAIAAAATKNGTSQAEQDASSSAVTDIATTDNTASDSASTGKAPTEEDLRGQRPLQHDPVEGGHVRDTPDQPAGLLVPQTNVPDCGVTDKARDSSAFPTCSPSKPVVGTTCTTSDVTAARSPLEQLKKKSEIPTAAPKNTQIVSVDVDPEQQSDTPLIGVQCFDVSIASKARVLNLHMRNIGLILAPEDAQVAGRKSSWKTDKSSRGSGGIAGGVRRTTNHQGATISYGGGRLSGAAFDLTPEGSFGAGVDLENPISATSVDGQTTTIEDSPPAAEVRGAADGFGSIARDVVLNGNAVFRDSSGTNVEFGRLFARPRKIPASCDFPIAIASGQKRELRTEEYNSAIAHAVQRPGITVTITDASGNGNARTAHVVVGSYLTFNGLPRFEMLDWTEQFAKPLTINGCDGKNHTEAGVAPPSATGDVAATTNAATTFGN